MIEIENKDKYLKESIKLSNEMYDETVAFLNENENLLRSIANRLIEKETIGESELDDLVHGVNNE